MSSPVIQAGYAIGILACVFHLANGIWTMGITWGVWTSPAAQSRALAAADFLACCWRSSVLAALFGARRWMSRKLGLDEDRMYHVRVNSGDVKQRVMVVGGGLAGLSATMKLAELGIDVDLMSLVPVKRSHSVCAQGGINSCNEQTRQLGDSEWKHFDDTVYGGDFLQHQPPVKEMAYWGPEGHRPDGPAGCPFNRTTEGFGSAALRRHAVQADGVCRERRRASSCCTRWTSRCGAGKRRAGHQVRVLGFPGPDLGRVTASAAAASGRIWSRWRSARFRRTPWSGHGRLRSCSTAAATMSMSCTGARRAGAFQAGAKYANGEFIQVHPTAIPGADKLRLMSESARGEGGGSGCRASRRIPRIRGNTRIGTVLLPGRALSEVRQPGAARHRDAGDLRHLRERRVERRERQDVRLPGSDPHRCAKS
jgi:hypothetical protein